MAGKPMTNEEMLRKMETVFHQLRRNGYLIPAEEEAFSKLLAIGKAAVEAIDLIEEGAECLPDADGYNAPLWKLHSALNEEVPE